MSKQYSLLFLGHETFKHTLVLQDAIDCWQQITVALYTSLRRLNGVDCYFRNNNPNQIDFYDNLPEADIVLFWGIPQLWSRYNHKRLRHATKCRAVMTICEAPITLRSDWRFAFRGDAPLTTRIDAPVWKEIYKQVLKRPRTVLIDHWDQDTPCDWTRNIEEWLREMAEAFEIVRYVQRKRDRDTSHDFKALPRLPFTSWLEETDRLETFVMTHCESYGYAALDMFARGIRVLCPTPFVPEHFREKFCIGTFGNKQQLIELLTQPPDPHGLIRNQTCLSDWSDVVRAIDEKARALLSGSEQKPWSLMLSRLRSMSLR